MKKLLTLSIASLFACNTLAEESSFKMAVVHGSDGASDISSGNYVKGIKRIAASSTKTDMTEQVAKQMNLCVAYSNSSQLDLANSACNEAIELSKTFMQEDKTAIRLVSLSLNNRAIFKTKMADYDGALQDLMEAAEIKNTSIIKANLLKLIHQQADNIQFKSMQVTQA